MIVVKVEIWPYGFEKHKKELGRLYIANVGGDIDKGKYIVSEDLCYIHNSTIAGAVDNLIEIPSHTRSRGFWPLVKQAISKLVHKKGI